MPEAIASVIGGGMQASASKKAAKTSAQAQLEAARMQQEAAREALGLSREQFEYGQEQDLYQRALQRQQAVQQAAQLQQIQPFINLGLGSLQGLSQMVNPTMQVDPGLYELAGMEPRQATLRQPSQADWNPTFDYGAAQAPVPSINFDEVDEFVREQLAQRLASKVTEDIVEEEEEEEPVDPVRIPVAEARVGGLGAGQLFQRRKALGLPKTLAFFTPEELSRMK